MGKIEISELECLANSTELVAPIEYSNGQRVEDIFYQFVQEYSCMLCIPVTERKMGFIFEKKQQARNVRVAILNSDLPPSERLLCIVDALNLVLPPILYPFIGSVGSVTNNENSVTVNLPSFTGVRGLFHSDKPHEYMHAYHLLSVKDLKHKGLIPNIDGYEQIGIMEPPQRVPTKEELKKFERRFLYAIIQQETKYL
ncbi:MAG: hypothetical protein V1759_04050 [bacterium]